MHDLWLVYGFAVYAFCIFVSLLAWGLYLHRHPEKAAMPAHEISPPLPPETLLHLRAVLLIAGVIFAYFPFEQISADEIYPGWAPWPAFGGVGLLAAGLGAVWLRRRQALVSQSFGGLFLLATAVTFALWTGALRLNQLTDRVGPHPYTYVMHEDCVLQPQQAGLPAASRCLPWDDWKSVPLGSEHTLWLRKGALGFYQLLLTPPEKPARSTSRHE